MSGHVSNGKNGERVGVNQPSCTAVKIDAWARLQNIKTEVVFDTNDNTEQLHLGGLALL